MKPVRLLGVATCVLLAALQSVAREVKIIASPNLQIDVISTAELKAVFLMQRTTLRDGSSVEPVLQKRGAVHEAFLKEYLGRDSEEIRIYYQGLVFTGKSSMPKEFDSDAEVIAYVASSKAAIGYVDSSASTQGIKVLLVSEGSRRERKLLVRIDPEYPDELRQRGIEGTVRLALRISPKGSVEGVQVLGGNPILAQAAVTAVKQWVYSAAAGTSTTEVSIRFMVP